MSDRVKARLPKVYSIPAHRGFADALVAGLVPRYADPDLGLARLTLLLPNQRAARNLTEAFVRSGTDGFRGGPASGGGGGLLLPRMVVVGDLDLDEALGPLLDPIGAADIPPACDPTRRWLRLAQILARVEEAEGAQGGAARLRRAAEIAQSIDRLAVEGIAPEDLLREDVLAIIGEQAEHWRQSTRAFLTVQAHWRAELEMRGEVDPPVRRNRLFDRAAQVWRDNPPPHAMVAAGITSASPSLARFLRVVSELPGGAVVLPDLDLALDDEVWDELGHAGIAPDVGEAPFGREDALTHPQYHLKLLLGRMGVARGEVDLWHRAGPSAAPPERSKAISNLFLPARASARWVDLAERQRRLAAVRLMESEHPGEEAQAIAILMREALETPEKRVALVTPDRGLASRVVAHLQRWGIRADDTAGRALPQTAAGRLMLLMAEVAGEGAPPVPLIALLGHPMVGGTEGRAAWLDHVRVLDLALRGPRPDAGLAPLRAIIERIEKKRGPGPLTAWWDEVEGILGPLMNLPEEAPLVDLIDALVVAGEALCGDELWAEAPGRCLSTFVENLRLAAAAEGTVLQVRDLAPVLRHAMDKVAVRPPWGGHPRVAIYGLLEARMTRSDLVICGGLTEGSWPGSPSPDPLLPPAVLRHLGVPGAEFRIGLAAHDLAGCLGAPQVVLSWAHRDEGGPVIPSRFVLRVQAMLGKDLAEKHAETAAVTYARDIDVGKVAPPHPRPQPMPSAEQRRVDIPVTALDRLRADPYQFYAQAILRLKSLDPLDAQPSAAWRGTAVHAILDAWHKDGAPRGALVETANKVLDGMSAHPLERSLWRPRLLAALEWIDEEVADLAAEGRRVLATEIRGEMRIDGIRIHGRADRIDRMPDGKLAIVDYKTGGPPSGKMVEAGFALQLGLIGMIAADGGFEDVAGVPNVFEYWSLSRRKPNHPRGPGFGWRDEPVLEGRRKSGIPREEFLHRTEEYLTDAIGQWLLGQAPFTARLRPDIPSYNDYDQLMRLDEWIGWIGSDETAEDEA